MGPGASLRDTADRVFTDALTPGVWAQVDAGVFPAAAWGAVAAAGLPAALLPEEAGGFGVAAADALSLLLVAGAHACPLPLAETMLAGWVLAGAGFAVPDGPLGVVAEGWDVAWGRAVVAVAVVGAGGVRLVSGGCVAAQGVDVAGAPLDTLVLQGGAARRGVSAGALRAAGAAMQVQLMAGALERVVADTVRYAQERVQFGKPIGRLQAVQQMLAVLAGQAAAARAAADIAAEAFDTLDVPAIAAAKVRAGEAAGVGAAIAHQVHGAIGFTAEHRLHRFTRRLWAWRDLHGTEAEWSLVLGRHLVAGGADALWPALTDL